MLFRSNIMKESESVGHIFEIVRTRFEKGLFASRARLAARSVRCVLITPLVARGGCLLGHTHAAPKLIIYDFACGLAAYCLNRDPAFFSKTRFLVDRLHAKTHSCGKSFHLDESPLYKDINSQANEQYNADLKRLQSQMSYMTPENFMVHLRLFMYLRNQKKKHV